MCHSLACGVNPEPGPGTCAAVSASGTSRPAGRSPAGPRRPMVVRAAWVAFIILGLATVPVGAAEAPAPAAPADGRRLLFGFEREEVEVLAGPLNAKPEEARDVLGRPYVRVEMKGGRVT